MSNSEDEPIPPIEDLVKLHGRDLRKNQAAEAAGVIRDAAYSYREIVLSRRSSVDMTIAERITIEFVSMEPMRNDELDEAVSELATLATSLRLKPLAAVIESPSLRGK